MKIERDASGMPRTITLRTPFDTHVHLRQDKSMRLIAPMHAQRFSGMIIMPNIDPPITTCDRLDQYRVEATRAILDGRYVASRLSDRVPLCLMTFYLTDQLNPAQIDIAVPGNAVGVKYYPRGLTTGSDNGVENPSSLWTRGTTPYEVLRILANNKGTLFLHAANGLDRDGDELDPYGQEIDFIRETLPRIRDAHPGVRISVEHLSTAPGAEYLRTHGSALLGCSITAHHLLFDRRDVFRKGLRPNLHCWPVIQSREHQSELRSLVAEDRSYVYLGTDSAPHPRHKKECDCVAGGIFTGHAGIELYAEAFEDMHALEALEDFASHHGPAFFGISDLLEPAGNITLVRESWEVPDFYHLCDNPMSPNGLHWECIRPLRAGQRIRWKLAA